MTFYVSNWKPSVNGMIIGPDHRALLVVLVFFIRISYLTQNATFMFLCAVVLKLLCTQHTKIRWPLTVMRYVVFEIEIFLSLMQHCYYARNSRSIPDQSKEHYKNKTLYHGHEPFNSFKVILGGVQLGVDKCVCVCVCVCVSREGRKEVAWGWWSPAPHSREEYIVCDFQ